MLVFRRWQIFHSVVLTVLVALGLGLGLCSSAVLAQDMQNALEQHNPATDTQADARSEAAIIARGDLPDGNFALSVTGTVDTNSVLRVRKYPWGPVIGQLTSGTKVDVIGVDGEFFKIRYQGGVGYIHRNYTSLKGFPSRNYPFTYPPGCREGGFIPRQSTGSSAPKTPAPSLNAQPKSKPKSSGTSTGFKPSTACNGHTKGNGTPAGAVGWGFDQMKGGQQKGINPNNGKSSKSIDAWNHYCLAFVSNAYGRKIKDLGAASAWLAYKRCVASGRKFSKSNNPPMGAVCFTAATNRNPYGHVFIATGEKTPSGDFYVLTTTGYAGYKGITRMPLKEMLRIVGASYLGWTPMP